MPLNMLIIIKNDSKLVYLGHECIESKITV